MRLLIATRNPDKLGEIRAILQAPGLALVSAADIPGLPEVEETGRTLEENAALKARTLACRAGLWALADDSGLEVDVLGGAPGVRSARYAGPEADYRANNLKLLKALEGKSDRRARFRCVMALSDPAGRCACVEGACEGVIVEAPRGREGFGYDPLFQPDGHRLTFAEMPPEEKNRLSHRYRALQRAREAWGELLTAAPARWPTDTA
jgi:XTP/dITP diphosphohydrolase